MSFFLCLAFPRRSTEKVLTAFHPSVGFTNVSTMPIGVATKGKKDAWEACLLQVGSSSASLIGRGSIKKNARINDQKDYFVLGVEKLIETENYLSLSFLVHWMHGLIDTEAVDVRDERNIDKLQLRHFIPSMEEDVRYLVSNAEDQGFTLHCH